MLEEPQLLTHENHRGERLLSSHRLLHPASQPRFCTNPKVMLYWIGRIFRGPRDQLISREQQLGRSEPRRLAPASNSSRLLHSCSAASAAEDPGSCVRYVCPDPLHVPRRRHAL